MDNLQTKSWASEFGIDYTNRNAMTTKEMDVLYYDRHGMCRSSMNLMFLGKLDRNIKILEVGANIGLQLQFLQEMGFKNLYGIEISSFAVELSKCRTKEINIIQGNALDIPFKDGWFDMVFTSGVLIHINPLDIPVVMGEIYRCSSHYIWGFEYYAKKLTQVDYRESKETNDLLWKNDFPKSYCKTFSDLKVAKIEYFKVMNTSYKDVMFLLEKGEIGDGR